MGKHNVGVRLALRAEGKVVNAYIASTETMDGARWIASLDVKIASRPEVFAVWKVMLSELLADFVRDTFGIEPDLIESDAGEHERAGTA